MKASPGKTVLIISYVFPPYPGIGGRRWTKFAKYLVKDGVNVHVLAAKNPLEEQSLLTSDIENPRIKVHRIPGKYPKVFQKSANTFFEKLEYRFWRLIMLLYSGGTIYDKSLFWKKSMLEKAESLIKEKSIDTVIVTGAPFRCLYYAMELKAKFPRVKVISDLRDPWTWGMGHAYGFSQLSQKRLNFEKMMERKVIENSDLVLVPVDVMEQHLKSAYPAQKEKIKLLPHGFDEDDFVARERMEKKNKKELKMIFYGTIYLYLENYFSELAEVLRKHSPHITIDFYSDTDRYRECFRNAGVENLVSYHGHLPPNKLFSIFKNYDFALLVHPDYGIDNISTKSYEVAFSRLPVIYVGNEGKTARFFAGNGIGVHIIPGNMEKTFAGLLDGETDFMYNFEFDVTAFSFGQLTRELEKIISL